MAGNKGLEEGIQWYKKARKARVVNTVEPSAMVSAGAIVLNKAVQVFDENDQIILGLSKGRTKKIVLRAAAEGDDYTPFKCSTTGRGECSIRCKSFIQDVAVGDLQLDLSGRKRLKFAVEADRENKKVVILVK